MLSDAYAVIMAGGGGTRLWPLSRRAQPKQVLDLVSDLSMFQQAIERILPLIPLERIRVVTVADQVSMLREQVPELIEDNFIVEPFPRGTASVIGLAAIHLASENPDSTMVCLTADHYIAEVETFRQVLTTGVNHTQLTDQIMTLGIRPTSPATGYGYIEAGEVHKSLEKFDILEVRAFREKPSSSRAEEYFQAGNYLWNSGMFIWNTRRILRELEQWMPELFSSLQAIKKSFGSQDSGKVLIEEWSRITPQTIDYGVMEKARDVVVIPVDGLGWQDIGNWDSLFEVLKTDERGNIAIVDQSLLLDSGDSLFLEHASSKKLIAALGVQDLIVIDTEDALLIANRERAEDIKLLVERLQELGWERFY